MIRLFVALPLPDRARQHLSLVGGGLPGARWVAPADYHITLSFIGEVTPPLADDIVAALDVVRAARFAVALRGLDLFGDSRRARQLYARVEPDAGLADLAVRVATALARVPGCPRDDKRFLPHVTLAHLQRADGPRLAALMAADGDLAPAPWQAEWFGLYSSRLGGAPPRYTLEERFALVPGA